MGNHFSITNLNGNHYHKIIKNLYVGDKKSIDCDFFKNQKKIIVINATKNIDFNKNIKSSLNYRVSINDDLTFESNLKMSKELINIIKIINYYLSQDYVVLVHCYAGRQRSCTIVTAYLIKYYNYTLDNAILYVKSKRPFAFFGNVNFKLALVLFSKNL